MGAPSGVNYREDFSDEQTFTNWVQQLGMECSDKKEFGRLGMMVFVGWTIAAVTIPRIADLYGRRPTFIGSMGLQLIGLALIIYS